MKSPTLVFATLGVLLVGDLFAYTLFRGDRKCSLWATITPGSGYWFMVEPYLR